MIFMFSSFQVLRLQMKDGEMVDMEEVFSDSGRQLHGSTVAVYRNGGVLIGTIMHKAMFCKVAYLK